MIVVDPLFYARGMYHGHSRAQAGSVGARNGHLWCHMMSTVGLNELDAFAVRIGLKLTWRDRDHYDLTPGRRAVAIRAGATEITTEQSVELTRYQRMRGPMPEWAKEEQQGELWDA